MTFTDVINRFGGDVSSERIRDKPVAAFLWSRINEIPRNYKHDDREKYNKNNVLKEKNDLKHKSRLNGVW